MLVLISALLHVPAVQRPLVKAAGSWATASSGLNIELQRIAIHWWKGRVAVEGIEVRDELGRPMAQIAALEIGGTMRIGGTWHVHQVHLQGGQIEVPAWQNWSAQRPPSPSPAEFPHITVHRIDLKDVRASLPAEWAGGSVQVNVQGGAMELDAGGWQSQAGHLFMAWDEGQTSSLLRPAGTLQAHAPKAAHSEGVLRLSVDSLDGLGWHLEGNAQWRGGDVPIEAAALRWEYAPADFAAWWARIAPPDFAEWTHVRTTGRLSLAGQEVTVSEAHLGEAVAVESPFTLTWLPGSTWPQAEGRLLLNWDAVQQLPGMDTLNVPWDELTAWTGEQAALAWEGGWETASQLTVHGTGGQARGALTLSEGWNRAEGDLFGVDLGQTGQLQSAHFSMESAEALTQLTTWTWSVACDVDAGTGLPGRLEGSGTVAWEDASAQGNLLTAGNGWPGDLAIQARWKPEDTRVQFAGQLLGLQPLDRPWNLHAGLEGEWRKIRGDSSRARVSLRNMVLLDGGRPTTFERLDAWLLLGTSRAQLRWESDLGTGDVISSTDWDIWQRWWQGVQMRNPAAATPALQADIQVRRFSPIAQLLQWPVELADGSRMRATVGQDGVEVRFNSARCSVENWTIEGLQLAVDGWETEVYANAYVEEVALDAEVLARACALDLHGDSLWAADIEWLGWGDQPTRFRAEAGQNQGNWDVFVYEAGVPWLTERLELANVPARLSWYPESDSPWSLSGFQWQTPGARLDIHGSIGNRGEANVRLDLELDGLPRWGGLDAWPVDLAFAQASVELCNLLETPMVSTTGYVEGVQWGEGALERIEWQADGDQGGLQATWAGKHQGQTTLRGSGFIPLTPDQEWNHEVAIQALPLEWINPLMPAGTVDLLGTIAGRAEVRGPLAEPRLNGQLYTDSARARIDYLGVDVWLSGSAQLAPELIALDRWTIRDDQGRAAWLTGTILHQSFADWNFDLSLDANTAPFHLMSLGRNDNDLFYGEAYVTGDANVSGYANNLRMEARLRTEKGTTFALPLDAASDARYADFIVFRQEEVAEEQPVQDLARMRMDLALDITSDATARIIFDEALGDEITGVTQGAINLTIDDFERFNMTGQLEVLEGGYLFTLQNIINKQFDVRPGGTVTWYGDPYAAEIDLNALYGLRTGLDPLLPSEPELPGRTKVELNMGLKGNLMRPEIGFDIAVPEVNTRLQALVESALINEEELNRQVMSLLVLQQFLSPDPTSAVGTTGLQERSTEFLASQIGFWLSQMTQDVDVGVDYGTDATSGEQALAVALSAQLLDDRLHVEGAVGTNHLFGGTTEDLQVQDVRVRYDLPPDGMFQLTGYSTTNPAVTGQTGTSTQGVGILMHAEFNTFREFWQRVFGRKPD